MKKYIVIPARYASTRFPGKPLFEIKGHTLLAWVLNRLQDLKNEFQILVATDHADIFAEAEKMQVAAVMTDSNLQSGTDRIAQALQKSDFILKDEDLVLNVQGDEPLVQVEWIRQLAELMSVKFTGRDLPVMGTLAHPLHDQKELENKNSVKVIVNKMNEAIYFSRFAIPHSRSQDQGIIALKHIGVYAYRYSFLKEFCKTPPSSIELAESLEQLRALDLGQRIQVLQVEQGIQGVDVPEDVSKVEPYLKWSIK